MSKLKISLIIACILGSAWWYYKAHGGYAILPGYFLAVGVSHLLEALLGPDEEEVAEP